MAWALGIGLFFVAGCLESGLGNLGKWIVVGKMVEQGKNPEQIKNAMEYLTK